MSASVDEGVATYAVTRPEVFVRKRDIPPSLLAAEADTVGWDVVHAVRLPEANDALEASGRFPTTFGYDVQEGWRVAGRFRPWRLVRGGSNSILFLRTPFESASMSFSGIPDLDLGEGSVTVSIKLQYLPQPPGGAGGTSTAQGEGDPQFLAARARSSDPDDPPAVVQSVDFGTSTPTPMQAALFRAAVGRWFNDNLHLLSHVFCALSLNGRAARDDFQWLRPTYTGYAYANGPTDELSCFGVLTMTSGNSPQGRTHQLAPAAVPPGCTTSVLVSRGSFLRHLMVPGLTRAFAGTGEDDFRVEDSGDGLVSTRPIELDEIEVDGASYRPLLVELRLQVVGDELQLFTKTRIRVSPGIDAFVRSTDHFRIVLVTRPDGSQTLDFLQSRPSQRDDYTEKEDWVVITEIIVGIIGAVAVIVAGILIPGAGAALVAVLLISLVAGLAAATPSLIAEVAGGKAVEALPSISELLTECTVDITWPRSAGLTLTRVELNGSLQLAGDLRPAEVAAP